MPRVITYFISLFVHMERNNMTALSTTIVKNYLICKLISCNSSPNYLCLLVRIVPLLNLSHWKAYT